MGSRSILIPAVILLAGCTGPYSAPTVSAKNERKPIPVRAHPVALESIPEIISATGELSAEDMATISAKVPGRVEKLPVDLGTVVEQGQILAELEKDDYTFRVKQAEALVEQTRAHLGLPAGSNDQVDPLNTSTVRQAAASLKEARLIHKNSTQLFKQGVVSNVDYERAGVALQGAEARHQAAIEDIYQSQAQLVERRATLALARQQLTDTVIRAPFRGAITRRQATIGEYLPVNAPVVLLVRQSPLRLRLEVPERLAVKVRPGQRIDLHLEGSTTTYTGKVVRLSPSIEAQNRSLLVEGQVPNEDNSLRAGSFAQGVVTVDPRARGISAPVSSVVNFAGVDRVFIVDGKTVAERIVKVGRHLASDRVEIVSGLKAGDLLIAEPGDRLAIGQAVEVTRF